MRRLLLFIGATLAVSALLLPTVQSGPAQQSAPSGQGAPAQAQDQSADEAAIRANIEKFVKAYNAGNAKAIAALFTADGETEDKDGDVAEGRNAIERTFANIFADAPNKKIEVFVESIRFIGNDLAVEKGTSKETTSPNETPDSDRYTVVHVRRDGKWQMLLARDEEGPSATPHERLEPLGWLVGEWIDDGGSTVVSSTCRWSEDGNFLLQNFKLQVKGQNAMNVSQRIGWDPINKRVHSWVFDSEGGYGESDWTRDGDEWIIKATAVRPDGTTGSATNFLTRSGKDGYIWTSTDRIVGEEREPRSEVKVVRKPPQPKD
jgi:uncharacterized protein (TIGR02246 family)